MIAIIFIIVIIIIMIVIILISIISIFIVSILTSGLGGRGEDLCTFRPDASLSVASACSLESEP